MVKKSRTQDPLTELFEQEGYSTVNPPILYDASIFLDLVGWELGSRFFLTSGPDGKEKCLRPDFTIPVALHYLESGKPGREAAYCYRGTIFRQRPNEVGEIEQAGAELLGVTDKEIADVRLFELAHRAVRKMGINKPVVRIGDEALFSDLISALKLPLKWQRKLQGMIGNRAQLNRIISSMEGETVNSSIKSGDLSRLVHSDPEGAKSIVGEILSFAGISNTTGRTTDEIADRFVEQIEFASNLDKIKDKVPILNKFLELDTTADRAITSLRSFERKAKIDLSKAINRFQKRLNLLNAENFDLKAIRFSPEFGTSLSYYTGFVFDIRETGKSKMSPIVRGGRYDKLISLLGSRREVPAVGFTLWLDRTKRGGG